MLSRYCSCASDTEKLTFCSIKNFVYPLSVHHSLESYNYLDRFKKNKFKTIFLCSRPLQPHNISIQNITYNINDTCRCDPIFLCGCFSRHCINQEQVLDAFTPISHSIQHTLQRIVSAINNNLSSGYN